MNRVILIGRLTRDPELKFVANSGKAVTTFSLAVDRPIKKEGQPEADFVNCVAFAKRAEVIAQYLNKGKLIGISGSIRTGSYEAKDGTKRYTTDIAVDEFQFLEKSNGTNNNYSIDMTPVDDSDIPF